METIFAGTVVELKAEKIQ